MSSVYTYVVAVRGFDDTAEEASQRALRRLRKAADDLTNGRHPVDEGIAVTTYEPGGGPCAPRAIKVEVEVSESGLPEAKPRAADDD